ncbi:MAG: Asd/ArgC dimerization domain-containing protein, partial [Caldisericaceae bacterium]
IRSVFVVTMQAISGGGLNGVSALQITGNIIPFIEKEEEKIELETRKILGSFNGDFILNDIFIFARANRVPVREGHTEVAFVDLDASVEEVKEAFSDFRGIPQELLLPTAPKEVIRVFDNVNHPQPILDVNANSGMSVSVGRIRKSGNFITFTLLSHNTVRGAAGGSVLNAEFAYRRGWI